MTAPTASGPARGRWALAPFLLPAAVPIAFWALTSGWPLAVGLAVLGAPLVAAGVLLGSGREALADASPVPPLAGLLLLSTQVPATFGNLLLAAVGGLGLLLWLGASRPTGMALRPVLAGLWLPTLAVAVALVLPTVLPAGVANGFGVAAALLAVALGLAVWLLESGRSAEPEPAPTG